MRRSLLLLLLAACVTDKEAGVLQEILDASFSVAGPDDAGVCSDDPILLTGTIDPRYAGEELGSRITVDGETYEQAVAIDNSGTWSVDIAEWVVCDGDEDCTVEVTVYMETTDTVADEPLATSASTTFVVAQDADLFYVDDDDDGFGAGAAELLCAGPDDNLAGYARNDTDCDDDAPEVHPQATEVCNGIDDNCVDGVDEGFDSDDWWPDADGDSFGDQDATPTATCTGEPPDPTGWSADATDCNDDLATTYPGAPEVCDDGEDNDCDGLADDLDPEGPESKLTYYLDADGDGFYDEIGVGSCQEPAVPYVTYDPGTAGDCDDDAIGVNPAADEVCGDGIDNNCNDLQDDDDPGVLAEAKTYGKDEDGDRFHPAAYDVVVACEAPQGYSEVDTANYVGVDCDDTDPVLNPGDADNDNNSTCDPAPDCDDNDAYVHRRDDDDDGFTLCDNDCNDNRTDIKPGAPDIVANGFDEDCDGFDACYVDSDDDGYGVDTNDVRADGAAAASEGTPAGPQLCIDAPLSAHVAGDCEDGLANVNPEPGRLELCADGVDNNCNGFLDDDNDPFIDPTSQGEWMPDGDGDGNPLTSGPAVFACAQPLEHSPYDAAAPVDCDDDDEFANYNDDDGDGFNTCDAAPDFDCNDGLAAINPMAQELLIDGVDQNCDGFEACYDDIDGDGFGVEPLIAAYDDLSDGYDCVAAGGSATPNDCDDTIPGGLFINPDEDEIVGDGVDQNCDLRDDCWPDVDNDNHGAELGYPVVGAADLLAGELCADLGNGYAAVNDDCDDFVPGINPDASEIPGDRTDQDCNDLEDCYIDADEDGFGTSGIAPDAIGGDLDCEAVDGFSQADDSDCDDGDNAVNPGVLVEVIGNDKDDDCNTFEGCFVDIDNDGFTGSTTEDDAIAAPFDCDAVVGFGTTDQLDCDETGPNAINRYPGAPEQFCTGEVEDCARDEDLVVLAGGLLPTGTPSEQIEAVVLAGETDVEICDGTVAEVALSVDSASLALHAANDATLSVVSGGTEPVVAVTNGTLTLTRLTLDNPSATQLPDHGGLVRADVGSVLTLTEVDLDGGSVVGDGGAVWANSTTVTFDDVTCTNNTATADGGCLWVDGATAAQVDADFQGNSALRGGSIYVTRGLDWTGGMCDTSTADQGGCLYAGSSADVTLADVDLEGTAIIDGGGFYLAGGGSLTHERGVCDGTAALGGCGYVGGSAYFGIQLVDGPELRGEASLHGDALYSIGAVEIAEGVVTGGGGASDIYAAYDRVCWRTAFLVSGMDIESVSGATANLPFDNFCDGTGCGSDSLQVCDGL